jgi:hypothetical protein
VQQYVEAVHAGTNVCVPESDIAAYESPAHSEFRLALPFPSQVVITDSVSPDLMHEAELDGNLLTGCRKSVYTAARMLRPAPWIRQAAARFVQEKMAGEPYLAMHIRPYPDECLQVRVGFWERIGGQVPVHLSRSGLRHVCISWRAVHRHALSRASLYSRQAHGQCCLAPAKFSTPPEQGVGVPGSAYNSARSFPSPDSSHVHSLSGAALRRSGSWATRAQASAWPRCAARRWRTCTTAWPRARSWPPGAAACASEWACWCISGWRALAVGGEGL